MLGDEIQQKKLFLPTFLGIVVFSMILAILVLLVTYVRLFAIARGHVRFMRSQNSFTASQKESQQQKSSGKRRLTRGPSLFKRISMKQAVSELRYVKLFALVGVTFLVCWLPFLYINLVADVLQQPSFAPALLQEISLHTIFISSLINPIIYGFYQRQFRRVIYDCFRRTSYRRSSSSITSRRKRFW